MPIRYFVRRGFRRNKDNPAGSQPPSAVPSAESVQCLKQGDEEYGMNASSNTSATDVQFSRASTNTRAKEPHQPATASISENTSTPCRSTAQTCAPPSTKKPQLVTVPTQQDTLALSTSQRLWNAAYDSLENDKDTTQLVRSYVKTLEKVLGVETSEPSTAAELKDPYKRQIHMNELVEKGKAKISRASKVAKGVGEVAGFILSAKGMIDLAVRNIPHAAPAALPWAGVCVGLQMLRSPAQATKSNLTGMTHVISRMDWYCALTKYLLKENIKGESFEAVLKQFEGRVANFYKALLLYQMKSVCSYYRKQFPGLLRDLLNLDDWNAYLKVVTDAEAAVRQDSDQYFQEHIKVAQNEFIKVAEGMETQLVDIHRSLKDFMALQQSMRTDDENMACIRALYVVNPQDDMARIEKRKDKLLYDAYEWILRTKVYNAFTSWDESTLLVSLRELEF